MVYRNKIDRIKNVILYLRKSRDENQEDALIKHRQRLLRLCREQQWVIKEIYEEITTGAKLHVRTEMMRLLSELHTHNADAVVVVDLERLGRGNMKEWGEILEQFKKASMLIVIPGAIYDPHDPNDELILNIGGTVAHHEYRRITNRFYDGKVDGARLGRWTNGKPPYGYKYVKKIINSNGKDIVIGEVHLHPDQAPIYRQIIDMYLKQMLGTTRISELLNQWGYPSPGGRLWHSATIYRLLVDEFYLGYNIFGKTKGRWDKTTKSGLEIKPRSEWIVSEEQSHPPLKTQQEHDEIILRLSRQRNRPVGARRMAYPLSGLLFCRRCGRRMKFTTTNRKKSEPATNAVCGYADPFGNKCDQMSKVLDNEFYDRIITMIKNDYLSHERILQIEQQEAVNMRKRNEIAVLEKEIEARKRGKEKAELLYMEGIEDLSFYTRYKAKYDAEISEMTSVLRALQREIAHSQVANTSDLEIQINEFISNWANANCNEQKNRLLSTIINKIWYDRDRNTGKVLIEIEYL